VIVGICTLSAIAVAGLLMLGGCNQQSSSEPSKSGTKPAAQPAGTSAATATAGPASQPANPQVVIDTNMGRIVVELEPAKAPATVANFLKYVDEKFYENMLFHRVMKGFMIQGGGFSPDGQQKAATHPPVSNESAKAGKNVRGTIAMARTQNPHSATCQFFINTVDNRGLDYPSNGGYTAFGRVVEGMDVVDAIADRPVQPSAISNAQPLEDVVIRSIQRK
jgi:cyclophilin family peptidyl-prolyl cis-trans isomerase